MTPSASDPAATPGGDRRAGGGDPGHRCGEVRIDDGDFQPAGLAGALGTYTWRQWRFDWDATPGRHDITVRATDSTGETQTQERSDVVPDGATGWMTLVLTVSE